jgi:hypothetical protein
VSGGSWAGIEAEALGDGGIAIVERATGCRERRLTGRDRQGAQAADPPDDTQPWGQVVVMDGASAPQWIDASVFASRQ